VTTHHGNVFYFDNRRGPLDPPFHSLQPGDVFWLTVPYWCRDADNHNVQLRNGRFYLVVSREPCSDGGDQRYVGRFVLLQGGEAKLTPEVWLP
jgi:hypothetical protein